MIKYALPAAVTALALGAPTAVEAQTVTAQPAPITQQADPMVANVAAPGTIVAQPRPGPADNYGYDQAPGQMPGQDGMGPEPGMTPQPVMMPVMVPVPPNSVWIPAHYNWDPASQNYVWLEGEFAQPPHPGARWVPGHWQQTPTAWTWVDGRWN